MVSIFTSNVRCWETQSIHCDCVWALRFNVSTTLLSSCHPVLCRPGTWSTRRSLKPCQISICLIPTLFLPGMVWLVGLDGWKTLWSQSLPRWPRHLVLFLHLLLLLWGLLMVGKQLLLNPVRDLYVFHIVHHSHAWLSGAFSIHVLAWLVSACLGLTQHLRFHYNRAACLKVLPGELLPWSKEGSSWP